MEHGYESWCEEVRHIFAHREALVYNGSVSQDMDSLLPGSTASSSLNQSVPWTASFKSTRQVFESKCVGNMNRYDYSMRLGLQLTSLIFIFICSLLSNSVVFIVFFKKPSLLTTSNRFVLNLAVSNFLMTILVMPFVIASTVTIAWPLGRTWCEITGVITTLLFVACILTLLLIAIDRYLAIIKPLQYDLHVTARKALLMIGTLWVLSLTIAIPPLLGWNKISYQVAKGLCTVEWTSSHYIDRMYSIFVVLSCFVIPYAGMLWIYVSIFKAAQKTTALARRNSVTPGEADSAFAIMSSQALPMETPRRKSSVTSLLYAARRRSSSTTRSLLGSLHKDDWKAAKTSLLVMSTFTLCWLPFFILIVLETSIGRVSPWWLETSSIWIALTGCALNPLVYVFRCSSIKYELRSMFCGRDAVRLGHISNNSGSFLRYGLREREHQISSTISECSRVDSIKTNGIRRESVVTTNGRIATFRISPASSTSSVIGEAKEVATSVTITTRPSSTVTFVGINEIKDTVHL